MANVDYVKLQGVATNLIQNIFGEGGQPCTVTHLDGATSAAYIVFPTIDIADGSPEVGTAQTTVKVAFITVTSNEICVGDTVTHNSNDYRIRDVRKYQPATTVVAYRVTLDD